MQTDSAALTNDIKSIFDIIYDKITYSEYRNNIFWILSKLAPFTGLPNLLWGAHASNAPFLKIKQIIDSEDEAKQLVMKIAHEYFETSVIQQTIESQILEQNEISMLTTELESISLENHGLPEYSDRANAIEVVKRETKKICDTYMDSNIVYGIHFVTIQEHCMNNFGQNLSSVVNRLQLHGIYEEDTINSIMTLLKVLKFHNTLRAFVLECFLGYLYNTPIKDPEQANANDDLSCSNDSIPADLETNYPTEQMEDI